MGLFCKIHKTKKGLTSYTATYSYKEDGKAKQVILYSLSGWDAQDCEVDEGPLDIGEWLKAAPMILGCDKLTKEIAIKEAIHWPYLYKIRAGHWRKPIGLIRIVLKKRDQIGRAQKMIQNKVNAKKYQPLICDYDRDLNLAIDLMGKYINNLC